MTNLIASILTDNLGDTIAAADHARNAGADLVEIRLDKLPNAASISALADHLPAGRWIATCRPTHQGGCFAGSIDDRLKCLTAAIQAGAGWIDFEYDDFHKHPELRSQLQNALAAAPSNDITPRLILSSHRFDGPFADPAETLRAMYADSDAAIAKIAWTPRDIRDSLTAFDLMHDAAKPTVVICMGQTGMLSRVLCKKFNSFATYCATDEHAPVAPGQLSVDAMRTRYRWDTINESTQFFGVIGHPVAHSLSPLLFNTLFAQQQINAVYLPLLVDPATQVVTGFLNGCLQRRWLDAGGFSVTIPHKQVAADWLGYRIDPLARQIGAVNTLVIRDGDCFGYNTDCDGALDALTKTLQCNRSDFKKSNVHILGAGGVARAVVAGLKSIGTRITIFNRSHDRAAALAADFDCKVGKWDDRHARRKINLLINCTSLGMAPDADVSPMPPDRIHAKCAVFDTVYNPLTTQLLADARAIGCPTVDGLSMFIHQAAAQYRHWFDQDVDANHLRAIVERAPT